MKTLKTSGVAFPKQFSKILERSHTNSSKIERIVQTILQEVRRHGDRALLKYTKKFDSHLPRSLEVSSAEIKASYQKIQPQALASMKLAAKRIENFHRLQKSRLSKTWKMSSDGILLGEQISPLKRVGIYVPGGLATYPSTVLMNALPARLAGVKEIIMVSPWTQGQISPYTLAAAELAGVTRIFKLGGAQAIAALAYGTKSVPAVDKIVGPGNIYVATAKRLVSGKVGIDMIAGPTEVVIVADEKADPSFVAADLLSQAEHDPQAFCVLITSSATLAKKTLEALRRQQKTLTRGSILKKALQGQGFLLLTRHIKESIELANQLAPEHLELQVKNPEEILPHIQNAGAIFLGPHTPVAVGDYLAGPNHVLPTAGTARFYSPLGVSDFLKRASVIQFSKEALKTLAPDVVRLANLEGLTAHAASVAVRLKKR